VYVFFTGGIADNDSSDHTTLPRRDAIRRLRERGEPVLLFGETELDAFRRLRRSEILEPEVNKVMTLVHQKNALTWSN
jgi:pre-mRNA-splicing factor 18